MQLTEARTLVAGNTIQIDKRGAWVNCTVLGLDSSDCLWVEEPEDTNARGFEVVAPPLDRLRLLPSYESNLFGVSIRYHNSSTGDPIQQIYTFRTQSDAEAFRLRHYGSGQNSEFLEFVTNLPTLQMPAGR